MHISACRADSRPSLQVRGGSASKVRADIHIAEELSFFLHSRKAAWSPNRPIPQGARMSALRLAISFERAHLFQQCFRSQSAKSICGLGARARN